ncbi:MAG: hypothetical protein WBA89_25165 [Microcoleus sp.]
MILRVASDRDAPIAKGITISGLPIARSSSSLDNYFKRIENSITSQF